MTDFPLCDFDADRIFNMDNIKSHTLAWDPMRKIIALFGNGLTEYCNIKSSQRYRLLWESQSSSDYFLQFGSPNDCHCLIDLSYSSLTLRKQCMSKLVEKNILFPSMPIQNKIVVLKSINKKGSVESSFKKCMQCRSRRQSWKRTTLCLRLL
jgi:hypothetical protein